MNLLSALPGLSDLNRRFATFAGELAGGAAPELLLAAALVSRQVEEGHVCLELATVAGRQLLPPLAGEGEPFVCPDLEAWVRALRASPVVGAPGDFTPLVLDGAHRLYLHRYWDYEETVAAFVRERAARPPERVDEAVLAAGLRRLFPGAGPDGQRIGAALALHRSFLVLSGGPGTGKTSTVVKILALLAEQPGGESLRAALAAPTGKAAARLKEALRSAKASLSAPHRVLEQIPEEVFTAHRLLGTIRGRPRFRHDADNPLPFDAVVIDEASMVDLPLMAKLVRALPHRCRLLLLGDRDQLASVEAGAVLGDLCGSDRLGLVSPEVAAFVARTSGDEVPPERVATGGAPPLAGSVALLDKNYRFGSGSGIGAVSRAVNAGDAARALEALSAGSQGDVSWVRLDGTGSDLRPLAVRAAAAHRHALQASTPEEALEALGRFQILCALRVGPHGVERVNALVERELAAAGVIDRPRAGQRWYNGRPVMITVNDYRLGLFNGDVGIALEEAGSEFQVYFPAAGQGLRSLPPARVPEHETVYAMTVHKSQGSEFDEVLLLLGSQPSRVLTRELLYTGLTRARRRVELWSTERVFREAVARSVERSSGLREALWGA